MRYHISLFTFIALISLATTGFAQDITTSDNAVTYSTSFPYFAEITGNDVYIRSGAGTAFYHCGKLYKGDKVTVVGQKFGMWSQIVPPTGSFSWISKDYIRISPEDSSIGIVTGDNVRVYAGSDYVLPENSTSTQGKLNKNDRVKLLGEELNNFYKIAVPSLPDAYLWVSTQYTKPVSPVVDTGPQNDEVTPAMEPVVIEPNSTDNAVPAEIQTETPLDKFYELQNQLDEERTKPIDQQDFSGIKEGLTEIANDATADKAKSYAEAILEQIEGYELAQEVGKAVILQNEQLEKTQERIEKAYENRKESVQDLGRFAVIGKLQNFLTYGPGHYLIVDESGSTICYAKPSNRISRDLSSFIDKKVGLVGTIKPHIQTAGALVVFDEIEILD
jgi:hypothetical protein